MFFSRISFRIGASYAVAVLLCSILFFGLTAFLLTESLKHKDRVLLTEKSLEYANLFSRDGVRGLQLKTSSQQIKDAQSFVVRLADASGKTLFMYSPDRSGDHDAPTLSDIDSALKKSNGKSEWTTVRGGDYGDHVEVISKVLPTGETLQVGKDNEDREAFLQSFTNAYFLGLIPILILSLAVGALLSRRLLNPIRWLTQTVESIRSGNPNVRVPLGSTKDELWKLGTLFNEMLEQNEKLIQGMRNTVDNVAHDLRTPIMRLQNSVEGALRGTPGLSAFQEALIDCQENSESILKLLNGIMDISEAEAGVLSLNHEKIEASQVVESVVDLYGFVAEDKKILLTLSIKKNFSFMGDRARMIQALSNIVDNALKYSPEETSVVIETSTENDMGVFRICDEGPGVPESEKNKIWDRLYRIDSSRSQRGLGLGLSLVKAIVLAHGGQVQVSSNPTGNGSVFSVILKQS